MGNEDNLDDSCTNVTSYTVSEAPSDLDVVLNTGAVTDLLTEFCLAGMISDDMTKLAEIIPFGESRLASSSGLASMAIAGRSRCPEMASVTMDALKGPPRPEHYRQDQSPWAKRDWRSHPRWPLWP